MAPDDHPTAREAGAKASATKTGMVVSKAWVIKPTDRYVAEEHGLHVEFADSAEEAVMWHASQNDFAVSELEAVRAEWADAYCESEVPASAWLDAGYSHSCGWCEDQVSLRDSPCFRKGSVFCSKKHRRFYVAERIHHKALKIRCRSRLRRRLPGAVVEYVSISRCEFCPPGTEWGGHARVTIGPFMGVDYCHPSRTVSKLFMLPEKHDAFRAAVESAKAK